MLTVMKREPEIDQAIVTATAKTIAAEDQVLDVLGEDGLPNDALTSTVVDRAEDVHDLAEQAADEDSDASVKTDMSAEGDGGQVFGG
jgi:hypothetical protein